MATAALLSKIAVKASPKKESKTPSIQPTTDEAAQIAEYKEKKLRMKTLEGDIKAISDRLKGRIEASRVSLGIQSGAPVGSINFGGMLYVTYMTDKHYIDEDTACAMKLDGYGKYIDTVYSIQVDVASLPDAVLKQLVAAGATIEAKERLKPTYYHDVSIGAVEPHDAGSFVAYTR